MYRIIVHIEGDIEAQAKKDGASEDALVNALAHDIEDICKPIGFTSYVDDITPMDWEEDIAEHKAQQ